LQPAIRHSLKWVSAKRINPDRASGHERMPRVDRAVDMVAHVALEAADLGKISSVPNKVVGSATAAARVRNGRRGQGLVAPPRVKWGNIVQPLTNVGHPAN
jgi:hypothetical protein